MREKTENDAYDEQEKWIRQAFGRRAAESANWAAPGVPMTKENHDPHL